MVFPQDMQILLESLDQSLQPLHTPAGNCQATLDVLLSKGVQLIPSINEMDSVLKFIMHGMVYIRNTNDSSSQKDLS